MLFSRWWVFGLWVLVGGCRSVAPDDEVRLSSQLVGQRAGVIPAWLDASVSVGLPDTLSLREATRLALIRHPSLRREIARVAEVRADFAQAHLLPNPVISVAYGFPFDGGGGNPLMASVVDQLAALWMRPARIDRADAALRRQILELSDAALQLVADVRIAYCEVVHGQHQRNLAAERVQILATRLDLSEQLRKAGEEDSRARNLALLEKTRAQDNALRVNENLDLARRRLAERLGVPEASLEEMKLHLGPPDALASFDERRCIELAATQRLDVAAAFTAIGESNAEVRLAALDRLPEVGVGLGLQRNFQNREAWVPSVQIVPDIFDTGRTKSAKADAIEAQSQAEAERILASAVYEARAAFITYDALSRRVLSLVVSARPAAHANASLSQRAFEAGVLPRTVWLADQARVLELELEIDELALASRRWFHELERAVGGTFNHAPLPEALAQQEENR